jgi:AbrB family looped-hinge helix DNA binding protein
LTITVESGKVGACSTFSGFKQVMPEPHESNVSRVRVDSAGRVVIPANVRQHLGIAPGQDLILSEYAQGIRLQTFEQSVKAVQEAFAPYRVAGVSVVDELIREREEEARHEYDEQ